MANVLQPTGRQAFLQGDVDWLVDNIKVVLLDADYTYGAAHDFLNDVAAGGRVATSSNLSGKTATNGYADSSDVTFTAVAGGTTVLGMWVYKDTGVESTSTLLAYYDTTSTATSISLATNGGDIIVTVNTSGWFRL